jgi:hypothetical protein
MIVEFEDIQSKADAINHTYHLQTRCCASDVSPVEILPDVSVSRRAEVDMSRSC